jgi:sec-independent protein translocase protein TatA
MGGFSLIHWLILGVVILLLFGGNRFSSMMGDVAKGLKSFKHGMADEDPANRPHDPHMLPPQAPQQLPPQAYTPPPQAYTPPPQAANPPPAYTPPPEPAPPRSPAAHPDQVEMVPDSPPSESSPPSPARGVPPGGEPTS